MCELLYLNRPLNGLLNFIAKIQKLEKYFSNKTQFLFIIAE